MAMTRAELQARATERAAAERLRAFRLCDGTFAVKSRSLQPGAFHLVAVMPGEIRCDCPGYFYRQSCTHAAAVERRVVRERKAPTPIRPESDADRRLRLKAEARATLNIGAEWDRGPSVWA
jgi:hypothetical protein